MKCLGTKNVENIRGQPLFRILDKNFMLESILHLLTFFCKLDSFGTMDGIVFTSEMQQLTYLYKP